jgi:hypothetical protein
MLSTKLLKDFDLSMILGASNSLVSDDNSVVLSPSVAITSGSTLLDACLEAQSNIQNKLDSNSVLNVYMSVKYKKFYQDLIKGAITSFEFGEFSRFGLNPVFLVNSVSDRLVIADESACDVSYAYTPTAIKDGVDDRYDSYWARVVTGNVNIIAKEKHIQKIIG